MVVIVSAEYKKSIVVLFPLNYNRTGKTIIDSSQQSFKGQNVQMEVKLNVSTDYIFSLCIKSDNEVFINNACMFNGNAPLVDVDISFFI